MASVHVSVSHQYHLVISELLNIQLLGVFIGANGHPQSGINVLDLFTFKHLVWHRLLHIENFSAQWKDCLEHAVTTLLGSATGRITFHEEEFAHYRVFTGAVGQLAGQTGSGEWRLTLHHLACFTCCLTGCSCQDHLLHNHLGLLRMFFKIIFQRFANSLIHGTQHFTVS